MKTPITNVAPKADDIARVIANAVSEAINSVLDDIRKKASTPTDELQNTGGGSPAALGYRLPKVKPAATFAPGGFRLPRGGGSFQLPDADD